MSKLSLWRTICFVCILCAVAAIGSPAQTFKSLVSFNRTDGEYPQAPLVQGHDGDLYGTTYLGSANGGGTVFKVTPKGTLTTLYSFCSQAACTDGAKPQAALVLATDGNFYSVTSFGGTSVDLCSMYDYGCGTVFKITPAGKLTTLYSFCSQTNCADGAGPSGLIQGRDGNFYGITDGGGVNCVSTGGCGTFFKITPAGKLTTLYSFCSQTNCADGDGPVALLQATNGNFYGTNYFAGSNKCTYGCGTIFEITAAGKMTTLHRFDGGKDGSNPIALIQATDGNLYGTAGGGGANCVSTGGCGTVFRITPAGKLTTLYSFCSQSNCTDGIGPVGLVQATNESFYGVTTAGGANNNNDCGNQACGTIFKLTRAGNLATLYHFCSQRNCADGASPYRGLVQATSGSFYGTAQVGGDFNWGMIFSISVGLGPFVETNPTSGKVGRPVTILGNNLTGATSVTFNGTGATFTVVSSTEIKTTVPARATTGFVKVTTATKTLKSNVVFRVTK